jgi:hypothetical protein
MKGLRVAAILFTFCLLCDGEQFLEFNVEGFGVLNPNNPVENSLVLSGTVDIDPVNGLIAFPSITVSNAGTLDGTYDIVDGAGTVSNGDITDASFAFKGSLLPSNDLLSLLFPVSTLAGYSGGSLCQEIDAQCLLSSGVQNPSSGELDFGGSLSPAAPEPSSFLLLLGPTIWLARRIFTTRSR